MSRLVATVLRPLGIGAIVMFIAISMIYAMVQLLNAVTFSTPLVWLVPALGILITILFCWSVGVIVIFFWRKCS